METRISAGNLVVALKPGLMTGGTRTNHLISGKTCSSGGSGEEGGSKTQQEMYRNSAPTEVLLVPLKTLSCLFVKPGSWFGDSVWLCPLRCVSEPGAAELCLQPCGFTGVFWAGSWLRAGFGCSQPGRSLGAVSLPSGSSRRAAEQMCRQRPAGCSAAPGVARKIRLCLLMIVKTCFYDNAALQLRFRTSFKRFQVTYSVTFRVINYGWIFLFSKQLSPTWLHQTLAQVEAINSLSASEPLQIDVHTSGFWELQNETNTKVV